MSTVDRRRFLTKAVLGTAAGVVGATALGSVSPEVALAEQHADVGLGAEMYDPNFVEGRVTAIKGNMLWVTSSDRSFHRIHVTSGTSVWKLRHTTFGDAAVGDGLYARGVRLEDGTLAADSVWLNIVNLRSTIVGMSAGALHLDTGHERVVGHVVPGTSAAVYNGTPAVRDMSMVRVGTHAQVIGAWRPETNEVDISTLYTSVA
ncbi:cell wall protein [Amycolatopsis anabasis]|uniref:cell wall protein n=1 Tax=Amycolatopsis anabasis TaxID=1840409 RepID=UPI0015D2E469|nr:cell wall protein [Amycolatopsis anabasis]